MDPFTQGVLGAALPQAVLGKRMRVSLAGAMGFLAGMAADLDVFIRSASDPLAFLDYHRHFTHSLFFIPFGGLICAGALQGVLGRRWGLTFRQTFLACLLGYGTHAMLDAATSYGTLLLWPFSDARISFSIISIVDPLFTLPLAAAVIIAARRRAPGFAVAGLAWAALYLAAGVWQQRAAVSMAREASAARGHDPPLFVEAKPSFGNILLWKTIYETWEDFHVDAVRVGVAPQFFPGTSLRRLDLARDLSWLDRGSQQARDVERFARFSQGFVALDPEDANRIIDVRYSFVPNEIRPLWSIVLSREAAPGDHVVYETHRAGGRENLARLWRLVVAP